MNSVPFAYPREGSMIVVGDGPELFVYSGVNDAPMWRQFCETVLVGVGATRDLVYSLDADGRLVPWRALDGKRGEDIQVDVQQPRSLKTLSDGSCLVTGFDQLQVIESGRSRQINVDKLDFAVFGATSATVAIAAGNRFAVLDATGRCLGETVFDKPIRGIVWRHPAQWAVSVGQEVALVTGDGAMVVSRIDLGEEAIAIACSGEGALLAAAAGQQIRVYELAQLSYVGSIQLTRVVFDITFGPGAWLGIGFDFGEANRVELITGQLCKTEAHSGKIGSKWGIRAELDHGRIRNAVLTIKAGGKPIAIMQNPEEAAGRSCWWYVLIAVALVVVCSGCVGMSAGLYYWLYV